MAVPHQDVRDLNAVIVRLEEIAQIGGKEVTEVIVQLEAGHIHLLQRAENEIAGR